TAVRGVGCAVIGSPAAGGRTFFGAPAVPPGAGVAGAAGDAVGRPHRLRALAGRLVVRPALRIGAVGGAPQPGGLRRPRPRDAAVHGHHGATGPPTNPAGAGAV